MTPRETVLVLGPLPRVRQARGLAAAHAIGSLVLLNLFLWVGELWWPVSLLLFVPRWAFLIPLIGVAASVGRSRDRRAALLLAMGVVITLGPLMGWNWPAPWFASTSTNTGTDRLRVMTFNEENDHFTPRALIDLLERERIDLVCLQEWYPAPEVEAYFARSWYADPSGSVLSRHPIVRSLDPQAGRQSDPNLVRVLVQAPSGRVIQLALVHGESMRFGLDELARVDVHGLETVIAKRAARLRRIGAALNVHADVPTLVAGDFNTPSPSPMLRALGLRFRDAFAEAGLGYGHTWPSVLPGLRIDYVFVSPEWDVRDCWVGPRLGSDHRPVIAEVELRWP
jgi:endonuclease/exonuclease/phosphatase (EEP) superfamily protein YafD